MAVSFEPVLAVSSGHFVAISAGPEQHNYSQPLKPEVVQIYESNENKVSKKLGQSDVF